MLVYLSIDDSFDAHWKFAKIRNIFVVAGRCYWECIIRNAGIPLFRFSSWIIFYLRWKTVDVAELWPACRCLSERNTHENFSCQLCTNIIWKGVFSRCWVVKRLCIWTCRRNCWIAILVFLTDTIKIVLYRHRWLAERQWQRHGSCARCCDVMLLLFNFKMKQLVPVFFRSI